MPLVLLQTGSTLSLQAEMAITEVEGLPEDAVQASANAAHIENPVDDAVEAAMDPKKGSNSYWAQEEIIAIAI